MIGSSLFLQVHLALGYALGPLADTALDKARLPTAIALVVLALAGITLWLVRRGRRSGLQTWAEATCPVCLGLGVVAARAVDGTAVTGEARQLQPRIADAPTRRG